MKVKTQPSNLIANAVELFLYGELCKEDAPYFVAAIRSAGDQPILLRIHSEGGSVFAGYAIYNALAGHKPGVIAQIDGFAASTATWIALAAKTVRMCANGFFVMHSPEACVDGDSDELRKNAELLDKCQASIVQAYAKKSGLPEDQINALMDDESWLTAEEAKAFGFVDEIIDPASGGDVMNSVRFDTRKFHNTPKNLIQQFDQTMKLRTDILNLLKLDSKVTDEAITLEITNRLGSVANISEIQNKLTAAEGTRDTALGEVTNLKAQFKTATDEAVELRNKVTTLESDVTAKTGIIADVTNKLTASTENVTRLEQLCVVKGIDPKNAIPDAPLPGSKKSLSDFETDMKNAKTPEARAVVSAALENAIKTGSLAAK